ncbi:MAG: iron ABC transporter permease [Methanosarcinales archaeon]|nr:MAG: iron ABC transporter permease [Methanosarcinales archaeon]
MSISAARVILFVIVLLLTIVALVSISITSGHADITANDAYSSILHRFFPDQYESSWLADICVWNLRLPRILLGILAGISLGVAGAIMQWALKNPFASPYTLGISSVAACGTYFAIIFGGASIRGGAFVILGATVISALIATASILYISRRRWATPARVVLIGVAVVIISSLVPMILMYFGDAEAVKEAVFWTIGDLNRASWDVLPYMAGTIMLCAILLLLPIVIPSLIGADERRTRTYAMVIASLLVATTVCFTGTIGLIGLLGLNLVAITVVTPLILPMYAFTTMRGVPGLLAYLLLAYLIVREGRKNAGVT